MNKKSFKIIIILLLVLAIVAIGIIIILMQSNIDEVIEQQGINLEASYELEKVDRANFYITIKNIVNQYYYYSRNANQEALQAVTVQESQNIQELANTDNFIEKDIYYTDLLENGVGYIEATYTDANNTSNSLYLKIYLDFQNQTFQIEQVNQTDYETALEQGIQETDRENNTIEKNQYNQFQEALNVVEEDILSLYYEKYVYISINNPQESFEMLDEEYRLEKFNNDIQTYVDYLNLNIEDMRSDSVTSYTEQEENGYTKYEVQTTNGKTFIIKEFDFMQYSILLDNYTVQSEEIVEEYNNLSSNSKVARNIRNIFTMLDNQDYEQVYSHLDNTFKQNNFPTIEQFEEYARNTFFETNYLGEMRAIQQGNIYVITVPYKERASAAAEERQKIFFMQLLDGTDFVMSFEV